MEIIYIIALEVTVILFLLKLLSLGLGFAISILLIGSIFILKKKRNIFLLILPFIFLIRGTFWVCYTDPPIGERNSFEVNLLQGRGKIEKIDGKYILKPSYLNIGEKADGNYLVEGKVKNIESQNGKNYYTLEFYRIEKISNSSLKKYFRKKSEQLLEDQSPTLRRVYKAVVLGESFQLTRELRQRFNYIGISHLMALSGFHIGIVLSIFSFLTFKLPLKKREKNIVLILFLTLYFLGVQHSPSLERAYIMGIVFLLGKVVDENTELSKFLVFSYVLSLILNPTNFNSISFKLSYIAVFIIAEVYPKIVKKYRINSKFLKLLFLNILLQILLSLILIKEFGTIQLFSFISNLIIVPVGSIFITFSFIGLFLQSLNLGFIVIPFINYSFKLFIFLTELFEKLPYMSIKYQGDREKIIFDLFYIFMIGLFLYKKRKGVSKNEKIHRRIEISQ